MKKASGQMGFGDNWKAAVEKVKGMHPPPGGKPAAVRDMLFEAVDYLRKHDLVTVPQAAVESLQMSMMSPERQLINPFFTGGARITVSFPTNTMEYEQRLQSMRGNNIPLRRDRAPRDDPRATTSCSTRARATPTTGRASAARRSSGRGGRSTGN